MTPERVSLLPVEKRLRHSLADEMAASSSPIISTFPSLYRPISEETLLAALAAHSLSNSFAWGLPESCFQERTCLTSWF